MVGCITVVYFTVVIKVSFRQLDLLYCSLCLLSLLTFSMGTCTLPRTPACCYEPQSDKRIHTSKPDLESEEKTSVRHPISLTHSYIVFILQKSM